MHTEYVFYTMWIYKDILLYIFLPEIPFIQIGFVKFMQLLYLLATDA